MSLAAVLRAASGCADAPLLGTTALHAANPSAYYRRLAERAAWVASDRAHVSSMARRDLRELLGIGVEASSTTAGEHDNDGLAGAERRNCTKHGTSGGGLESGPGLGKLGIGVAQTCVCPLVRRVKVGGEHGGRSPEGQYTLCLPVRFPPERREHCVVYSFGSGHDYSFDDAMRSRFGCEVHAFDPTTPREPRCRSSSGVSFHPVGLGTRGQERIRRFTLGAIARLLQHSRIDVLKIDIEGFEWAPLAQMLGLPEADTGLYSDDQAGHSTRAPRQDAESLRLLRSTRLLLFELHFFRGRAYGTWEHKIRSLRALRRIGFRPFFTRENPLCEKYRGVPCYEASFLNVVLERRSGGDGVRADIKEDMAWWNVTATAGAKAPPCLHAESMHRYAFTPRPEHRTGILDTATSTHTTGR